MAAAVAATVAALGLCRAGVLDKGAFAAAVASPGGAGGKTARVIWLHGLGDTAAGWSFLPGYLAGKGGFDHVDFLLPTAPTIPITVNGGMAMPGWFDMADLPYGPTSEDDRGSIEAIGVRQLTGLIEASEAEGFAAEQIVVGGFSQGGCVAMLAGLRHPRRLAGVASLSGWLPSFAREDAAEVFSAAAGAGPRPRPPVLWGHGEADPTVTFAAAQSGLPALREAGVEDLDFRSFPGLGHGAGDEELAWLADWLAARLPPPALQKQP